MTDKLKVLYFNALKEENKKITWSGGWHHCHHFKAPSNPNQKTDKPETQQPARFFWAGQLITTRSPFCRKSCHQKEIHWHTNDVPNSQVSNPGGSSPFWSVVSACIWIKLTMCSSAREVWASTVCLCAGDNSSHSLPPSPLHLPPGGTLLSASS